MSPSSTQQRAKPFLFDRSFDDPRKVYLPGEKFGPKIEVDLPKKSKTPAEDGGSLSETGEDEPPPEPEKKYTEEDLEAAREEGQIAGHTAALEDAETSREHYVADALNLIGDRLDTLEAAQKEANRDNGEMAMRMVFAVIEKVLPDHAQAFAMESMETLVREVLPLVYHEPTIAVRVHNMVAEDVQAKLDEVIARSNFNGKAEVIPDYELQPGDCRVEWDGGGADYSQGRLWSEIRAIMRDNIDSTDLEKLDREADAYETQSGADDAQKNEEPDSDDAAADEQAAEETQPEGSNLPQS